VPLEEDQRTVLTAGDYVDQQLFTFLKERYPEADFNLNMIRRFKEEHSFVGNAGKDIEVEIPVDGKSTVHDITEEIKRACESILPAMVESTLELIAKFDPEYQDAIRENIILAGGGSQIRGLAEYFEEAIGEYGPTKVRVVEDSLYGGADGALELAKEMPEEYWTEL
jgi:rod shape-determining protein MreB